MKTLTYKNPWGTEYQVLFEIGNYQNNNRLFVGLFCYDKDYEDFAPYGGITTNIAWPVSRENCSFVDTNNMGKNIVSWLEENGFAKRTGVIGESGFCSYPEMEFDLNKIKEFELSY